MKNIEELHRFRGRLAYKYGMEPFYVWPDTVSTVLLEKEPKTLEELKELKGFPPEGKRVSLFGEEIIAFFNGKEEILVDVAEKIADASVEQISGKQTSASKLKPIM
jgi:hypothetical protein